MEALPGGLLGPSLSRVTWPATLRMPERHEEFIRMLCVRVCLSQFSSDKPAATACQEVLLWFLYGRTCGRSACYRSRRVKARRPGGWLGWQGERRPGRREAAPDRRVPGPNTAAPTLEAVAGCAASSHQGLSST